MVDEGRVIRLLRQLDERTDRLRSTAAAHDRSDLWLDAIKYQLVTAIETTVDVAHHFASSERWGATDTNAKALLMMGRRGVIQVDLAEQLSQAVGFRNILVHRYVEVDDQIVVNSLHRIDDLDAFVTQVSSWLKSNT